MSKEIRQLKLDNLAYGGDCVGHLDDGYTVFVNGGIPGEIVKVELIKQKKNYARAKIIEIIKPSPDRIKPECSVFADCGGCHLQQMSYKAELRHKKQVIYDLLTRVGKITDPDVKEVIGTDFPWNYRNKAQFPLRINDNEEITAGFYRRGTHELVNMDECKIQHPLINRIVNYTLNILNKYDLTVYNEKNHQGLLRHLLVRAGVCTNQALLTIVTNNESFSGKYKIAEELMTKIPELTGVVQNINKEKTNVILGNKFELLAGKSTYTDYIGLIKYKISTESFFQVNTIQAEKLYDTVKEFCGDKTKTIIDCYCGTGSITLYLSDIAEKIIGIEENISAIRDAEVNAKINNINNCTFISGKVEEKLPELVDKGLEADTLIFDPPRKGLKEDVIVTVKKLQPKKIIYVSCNPATLARDLKKLKEDYSLQIIQPVDMFPRTYHVETVALMIKID